MCGYVQSTNTLALHCVGSQLLSAVPKTIEQIESLMRKK